MSESHVWLGTRLWFVLAAVFLNCLLMEPLTGQEHAKPCGSACVVNKYVGAGSCGASGCHGAPHPRCATPGHPIFLNEYRTWFLNDPHFKAASVLEKPLDSSKQQTAPPGSLLAAQRKTQQIAYKLNHNPAAKEQIDPATSPRCLVCHGLAATKEERETERERDFGTEGVGCESCHGPASGWLEPHIREPRETWTPAQYVPLGMYDYKSVSHYAKKCLSCHLGSEKPNQAVDHDMIAAGHPDLLFELDLFSAKQPAHWQRPDAAGGVRLWAIGQAVQLREALGRLQRRAKRGKWPENSELDCFGCHHPLGQSWRSNFGSADTPGWNDAHSIMVKVLLDQKLVANNKLAADLKAALENVVASTRQPDRNTIADNANLAWNLADNFVNELERLDKSRFDKTLTANLMQRISHNDSNISEDTRTAEQAWMALDTLYRYYLAYDKPKQMVTNSQNGFCTDMKAQDLPTPVSAALDKLFQEFNNPSLYDAPRFSSQMKEFRDALSKEGIGR